MGLCPKQALFSNTVCVDVRILPAHFLLRGMKGLRDLSHRPALSSRSPSSPRLLPFTPAPSATQHHPGPGSRNLGPSLKSIGLQQLPLPGVLMVKPGAARRDIPALCIAGGHVEARAEGFCCTASPGSAIHTNHGRDQKKPRKFKTQTKTKKN